MDHEERKTRLAEICAGIVQQNLELMDGLDEPDFDPAVRLDNTQNNAAYKLTDFFSALAQFPHGDVPVKVTDRVLTTTDELIAKIRERYDASPEVAGALVRVAHAFRNSKRIWRIRNPICRLDQKTYAERLDTTLCDILCALDDLNYELAMMDHRPAPPAAARQQPKRRGRGWSERDETLHQTRAQVVAAIRSKKEKTGLSWPKCVALLRANSAYVARMRGISDSSWIRYAKSGFSG